MGGNSVTIRKSVLTVCIWKAFVDNIPASDTLDYFSNKSRSGRLDTTAVLTTC